MFTPIQLIAAHGSLTLYWLTPVMLMVMC